MKGGERWAWGRFPFDQKFWFGISDTPTNLFALDWFTLLLVSYLTNRTQYVKLGNVESSFLQVEFLRDQSLDHYYFFFT